MEEQHDLSDPRLVGFKRILDVMDSLRGPEGCPWDKEQTTQSLRPFLLEEAFEVLEALDGNDANEIRIELGDLLFQIIFHSKIFEEKGDFHAGDVGAAIADKLLHRHPHVFGSEEQRQDKTQWKNWEKIKKEERGGDASVLDGVPNALPALARSQRLQDKAARVGFDWPDLSGPTDKIQEELVELNEAMDSGDRQEIAAEYGDLLFSIVALARHLDLNAEDVLREANKKFDRRFRHMETLESDLSGLSLEELDKLWNAAKRTGL